MASSAVQLPVVVGPSLTVEQVREIYALGEEAVIFAMLELAARLRQAEGLGASVSSPATPSGMRPIYQKPATTKRRKKPGRKAGHEGSRRPPPERIDERKEHRAECCPHCQGTLQRCAKTRTRYTFAGVLVSDFWAAYNNRSQRGADTQAVLMSIYRTLKQRGHDPLATITQALTDYLRTGTLPPLPP